MTGTGAAASGDNTSLIGGGDEAAAAAAAAKANGAGDPLSAAAAAKVASNRAAGGAETDADAAAAAAAAANGAANGEGENEEWFKDFLTDLDKSEAMSFRNFASRHTDKASFARSHIELHKSAVFLPKPEDKEADAKWDRVYERLGRPKEAKDYAFKDPKDFAFDDVDKEYRESFRGVAHRARLTQNQVSFLEDWQVEQAKLMRDAQKTATEEAPRKARNLLKSRWAGDFENNINHANTAFKHYAGTKAPELLAVRLADGSYLRDHPEFVSMMARVGRDRAEDETVITPMNQSRADSARAEIEKIQNDALAKGWDPTHRMWPHAQLEPLYKRAYGTARQRTDGTR